MVKIWIVSLANIFLFINFKFPTKLKAFLFFRLFFRFATSATRPSYRNFDCLRITVRGLQIIHANIKTKIDAHNLGKFKTQRMFSYDHKLIIFNFCFKFWINHGKNFWFVFPNRLKLFNAGFLSFSTASVELRYNSVSNKCK